MNNDPFTEMVGLPSNGRFTIRHITIKGEINSQSTLEEDES